MGWVLRLSNLQSIHRQTAPEFHLLGVWVHHRGLFRMRRNRPACSSRSWAGSLVWLTVVHPFWFAVFRAILRVGRRCIIGAILGHDLYGATGFEPVESVGNNALTG